MNEVLADLSAITGDARYLRARAAFLAPALLDPLARGATRSMACTPTRRSPRSSASAASTTSAGGAGALRPRPRSSSGRPWSNERSFATGGHGDVEHFFPKNEFAKHLGSAQDHGDLLHAQHAAAHALAVRARRAASRYIDYFERALFNGILASQDPETGMKPTSSRRGPGYVRLYHTPFDSFWCCTGIGHRESRALRRVHLRARRRRAVS